MKRNQGFTLLEVILAVSIMSLLVATLYMAFGQANRTWSTQNFSTDNAKRTAVITDMLNREFVQLRPYTFQGELGAEFFFCGSSNVIFYVTTQGFGARHRWGRLFFGCLYIAQSGTLEEEIGNGNNISNKSLYLCKLDRPEPWFLDELISFKKLERDRRENYSPSNQLREESVLLFDGIFEGRFSFSDSIGLAKTQNATEPNEDILFQSLDDAAFELSDLDIGDTIWDKSELPTLVQLSWMPDEGELRLIKGHPTILGFPDEK